MKESLSQVVDKIPPNIRDEVLEDFQDIEWSRTLVDILPSDSPLRVWHKARLDFWTKNSVEKLTKKVR